jgi:hypothetical protein
MKPSRSYMSYLLRIWRSGENEQAVWRASLEDPMTGQRHGFHTLSDLYIFLEGMSLSGNEQAALGEGGEQVCDD